MGTQLLKAGSAVALWNALHEKAKSCGRLDGRETSFLDAAMSAAWTAAIVNCYALQDTQKSSLSLTKLVKLSAEINPATQKAFLPLEVRNNAKSKIESAERTSANVAVLRHNQQAHISAILTEPDLWEKEPSARNELQQYVSKCVEILCLIEQAAGYTPTVLPDFPEIIQSDLDVLVAAFQNSGATRKLCVQR